MKQILVDGRLGRDAELRVSANGRKYVSFSLANNTHVKNEDKTTWYDVTCFDPNTVENRLEYLKKGKLIFVSGVYDAKAYMGKDGVMRVSESILADRISFIQVGNRNEGQPQQAQAQAEATVQTSAAQASVPSTNASYEPSTYSASASDNDDELPF